jgi:hypothetical protein
MFRTAQERRFHYFSPQPARTIIYQTGESLVDEGFVRRGFTEVLTGHGLEIIAARRYRAPRHNNPGGKLFSGGWDAGHHRNDFESRFILWCIHRSVIGDRTITLLDFQSSNRGWQPQWEWIPVPPEYPVCSLWKSGRFSRGRHGVHLLKATFHVHRFVLVKRDERINPFAAGRMNEPGRTMTHEFLTYTGRFILAFS